MLMHRRAKEQGESKVASLCATGIDQLRMQDICIEGVDSHCSAVVDHLLSDNELVGEYVTISWFCRKKETRVKSLRLPKVLVTG
jgi:hypothetical protein